MTRQKDGDVGAWQLRIVSIAGCLAYPRNYTEDEEEDEAGQVGCSASHIGSEGYAQHHKGLQDECGDHSCGEGDRVLVKGVDQGPQEE